MTSKNHSRGGASGTAMSLGRIETLLHAYGGEQRRWPAEEREQAQALLGRSAEARALLETARCLDTVLDSAPAQQPSPGLAERIMDGATPAHGAPVRSRQSRIRRSGRAATSWRYIAAAVPMAAAAALVLWLARGPQPSLAPSAQLEMDMLGTYETPTDALLDPFEFDLLVSVPSLVCPESELGCPELDLLGDTGSRLQSSRRRQV